MLLEVCSVLGIRRYDRMAKYTSTIPMILETMIATIETIPPVLVQKESLLAFPGAGALVAEALIVVDAPFVDVEGGRDEEGGLDPVVEV